MHSINSRTLGTLPTSRRVLLVATSALLAMLAFGFWHQRSSPLASRHLDRVNPWRGLPGCLWVAGESGGLELWPVAAHNAIACGASPDQPATLAQAAAVPQHAQTLINQLQPWLAAPAHARPGVPATDAAIQAPITARINATWTSPVQQGASVQLALHAADQARAQQLADCMTGRAEACLAAGIAVSRWQHQYEGAATRMTALAQIDIATGAIEVLASAHTRCFEQDALHLPRDVECPDIAHAPTRPEPWRVDNHALYSAAMLGSLVKPVLALALLRSDLGPKLQGGAARDRLLRALQTSDTPQLLDALYCRDKLFAADCVRPTLLPQAAADLGLGGDSLPVLLGDGDALRLPAARMLHARLGTALPMPATTPELRAACAAREWSRCDGEVLAGQTAELWGAGNTQGTPLTIAAMFQRLGAAANGAQVVAPPHLATRIETGAGTLLPAAPSPLPIQTPHARMIVEGLGLTHTAGGTAHSACVAVFGSAATCNHIDWLAGKTGTPGFIHDRLTLAQRRAACDAAADQADAASGNRVPAITRAELARCAMAPVKWYAALIKNADDPSGPWTKVIVVLTERNWSRITGRVDSALDRGTPNVAAEMAMRYLKTRAGDTQADRHS